LQFSTTREIRTVNGMQTLVDLRCRVEWNVKPCLLCQDWSSFRDHPHVTCHMWDSLLTLTVSWHRATFTRL